jgi:hypothetical protein
MSNYLVNLQQSTTKTGNPTLSLTFNFGDGNFANYVKNNTDAFKNTLIGEFNLRSSKKPLSITNKVHSISINGITRENYDQAKNYYQALANMLNNDFLTAKALDIGNNSGLKNRLSQAGFNYNMKTAAPSGGKNVSNNSNEIASYTHTDLLNIDIMAQMKSLSSNIVKNNFPNVPTQFKLFDYYEGANSEDEVVTVSCLVNIDFLKKHGPINNTFIDCNDGQYLFVRAQESYDNSCSIPDYYLCSPILANEIVAGTGPSSNETVKVYIKEGKLLYNSKECIMRYLDVPAGNVQHDMKNFLTANFIIFYQQFLNEIIINGKITKYATPVPEDSVLVLHACKGKALKINRNDRVLVKDLNNTLITKSIDNFESHNSFVKKIHLSNSDIIYEFDKYDYFDQDGNVMNILYPNPKYAIIGKPIVNFTKERIEITFLTFTISSVQKHSHQISSGQFVIGRQNRDKIVDELNMNGILYKRQGSFLIATNETGATHQLIVNTNEDVNLLNSEISRLTEQNRGITRRFVPQLSDDNENFKVECNNLFITGFQGGGKYGLDGELLHYNAGDLGWVAFAILEYKIIFNKTNLPNIGDDIMDVNDENIVYYIKDIELNDLGIPEKVIITTNTSEDRIVVVRENNKNFFEYNGTKLISPMESENPELSSSEEEEEKEGDDDVEEDDYDVFLD